MWLKEEFIVTSDLLTTGKLLWFLSFSINSFNAGTYMEFCLKYANSTLILKHKRELVGISLVVQ